jgi:hypothetical protein
MYNGSTWVPTTLSPSLVHNCTGAIVYDGAYNGPAAGEYNSGYGSPPSPPNSPFVAGWTADAFTTVQNRDLCWAAVDISDAKASWETATKACAALTTDNHLWRLPNLKELQVLYEAIGGNGDDTRALTALDTNGHGISNGASDMQTGTYWSSTEHSSGYAYFFFFNGGGRGSRGETLTLNNSRARCVRSL